MVRSVTCRAASSRAATAEVADLGHPQADPLSLHRHHLAESGQVLAGIDQRDADRLVRREPLGQLAQPTVVQDPAVVDHDHP